MTTHRYFSAHVINQKKSRLFHFFHFPFAPLNYNQRSMEPGTSPARNVNVIILGNLLNIRWIHVWKRLDGTKHRKLKAEDQRHQFLTFKKKKIGKSLTFNLNFHKTYPHSTSGFFDPLNRSSYWNLIAFRLRPGTIAIRKMNMATCLLSDIRNSLPTFPDNMRMMSVTHV